MLDSTAYIEAVAQKHPLKSSVRFSEVPYGATVLEIVESHDLDPAYGLPIVVLILGTQSSIVPVEHWHLVRPKPGTRVEIGYPVEAGAIGALVAWGAGQIAGAITANALLQSVIAGALTVVAGLAIQALIPPPPQRDSIQSQTNYAITGTRNNEIQYRRFPKVLGRHRMYPVKTATGFSETVNDDEIYYYGRMSFGYGPVALEDLRIGTTPIHQYDDIELEFLNVDQTETLNLYPELGPITRAWRSGDASLELYPNDIAEDQYSIELTFQNAVTQNTRLGAISASVDIAFPRGIGEIKPEGDIRARTITFDIEYRPASGGAWTLALQPSIQAKTRDNLRRTYTLDFPSAGEYEIRVTRTREDTPDDEEETSSFLSAIRSIGVGQLPSHSNLAEIAFRIRASGQLNGVIDSLNAIVFQMARKWENNAWTEPRLVRHPAWLFLDALQGAHMQRPVPDSKIDLAAIRAWFDDEPHWACDFVVDNDMRLAEVLDVICAAGRAQKALTDFKYSVVRDQAQGPVRQVFTPRNVRNFRWSKTYGREIHAFRVRVRSERLNYEFDEFNVYRAGYDASNATEFETLEIIGVTLGLQDVTQGNAWKLARYHLAQHILRPETFEFEADFEIMRNTRGDKIRVVHDGILVGIGQGRIKAVSGNTITLDENNLPSGTFRLNWRASDGSFTELQATGSGSDWTLTSGAIPATAVGDLVAVEQTTQESLDLLITNIYPDEEGGARVTAVPASPAVLDADTGTIPDYVPVITNPAGSEEQRALEGPAAPVVETLRSDDSTAFTPPGGVPEPRIEVKLASYAGRGDLPAATEIRWREFDSGSQWSVGAVRPGADRVLYTGRLILGLEYEVEVRTLGPEGRTRGWVQAGQATAALTSIAPPDVTGFTATVDGFGIQLSWTAVENYAVRSYQIRYSAAAGAGWDGATAIAQVAHPTTAFEAPLRAGVYWIKAVDFAGQFSTNAVSVAITNTQVTSTLNAAVDDVISDVEAGVQAVENDLATLRGGWQGTLDTFLANRAPTLTIADLQGIGTHLSQNFYTSQQTDTQISAAITSLGSQSVLGQYSASFPGELSFTPGDPSITVTEDTSRILIDEAAGNPRDLGNETSGAYFGIPPAVTDAFTGRTIRVTIEAIGLTTQTANFVYSTDGGGNSGLQTFTLEAARWQTYSFLYKVADNPAAQGDNYIGIFTDGNGGTIAVRSIKVALDEAGGAQALFESITYTGTQTDFAIADAISILQAFIENPNGSSVGAELAQNHTTTSNMNQAIAAAVNAAKAEIEDENGNSVAAMVADTYLAQADFNSALASSENTVSAIAGGDRFVLYVTDASLLGQGSAIQSIETKTGADLRKYVRIRDNSGVSPDATGFTNGAREFIARARYDGWAGRTVRVRIEARKSSSNFLTASFSTSGPAVGSSGTRVFAISNDWKYYDFTYEVPTGDFDTIYVTMWADQNGNSVDVRQIIIEPVGAEVTTLQTAVTDLEGNSQAAIVLRAKSGTSGAELELASWENASGGSTAAARISAPFILLEGSIPTALIGDLQVDTLKIAGRAVTLPQGTTGATWTGDNTWKTLTTNILQLDDPTDVLLLWNIEHQYFSGQKNWSFSLSNNWSNIAIRENMQFGIDYPSGQAFETLPAGTNNLRLRWKGADTSLLATGFLTAAALKK